MVKTQIELYLDNLRLLLDKLSVMQIKNVVDVLIRAKMARKNVYVFGNGGSASTASHITCDLGRCGVRAISLTNDVESMTAIANDVAYEQIFTEKLRLLLNPGDIVVGISGSGNSCNVLNAIALANELFAYTIALTGFDGGLLAPMADTSVIVPSQCMERIEDVHLVVGHILYLAIAEEVTRRKGHEKDE